MARTTVASLSADVAELKALMVAFLESDTAPAKPKADAPAKEISEAAAHCRDARLARREATPRGGLTKAERRTIADANREELQAAAKKSKAAYNALWTKLCKAHKAA